MLHIRKINPMVRAIGTMGAVAALVGGITFADLNTTAVALSPNNLVTATAALFIGAGTNCPAGNTTQTTGFTTASPLVPGGPAATANFCLDNTGNVPLNVTVSIPSLPPGNAANHTTLAITCNSNQGSLVTNNQTLSSFSTTAFTHSLPANSIDNCVASATLDSGYSSSGNESIPAFDIDFVGNQAPVV